MEPTHFDLTPKQKGLLQSLSQETGKPVAALIAEALDALEAQVHSDHANGAPEAAAQVEQADPPIWEVFAASDDIPDEEWDKLPTDLATQHDHYIYGTPKRQI